MELFSIKFVCDEVGVNANTLRAWERRYAVVAPQRTEAGRRRYSKADVARLKLIVRLVEHGRYIGKIAGASHSELVRLVASDEANSQETKSPMDASLRARFLRQRQEIIADLKKYRLKETHQLLIALRKSCDARAFVLEVASPLFQEVGRLVAEEKLSIGQEHALSALIREQLALLMREEDLPYGERESITFTTPEGERHEFGILLASILAHYHSYEVHYLGASLPASSVVEVLKALGSRLVVIGTTQATRHYARVSLGRFVREVMNGVVDADVCLGGPAELGPSVRFLPRRPFMARSFEEFDQFLVTRRLQRRACEAR